MRHTASDSTILIADKSRDVRDVVYDILRAAGYNCLLAADGLEAMQLFRHARPQLVIVGARLQIVSGVELMKHVRLKDPDTAVILISGEWGINWRRDAKHRRVLQTWRLQGPHQAGHRRRAAVLRRTRAGTSPTPDRAAPTTCNAVRVGPRGGRGGTDGSDRRGCPERALELERRRMLKAWLRRVGGIVRRRDEDSLVSQTRLITVLFSNIRDYVSLCERIELEQLRELITAYFTEMTQVVYKYNGTVDKYIGDCVQALYNAPLESPDHALQAVQTALELQERTRDFSRRWEARVGGAIRCGVGISTGPALMMTRGRCGRTRCTQSCVVDKPRSRTI